MAWTITLVNGTETLALNDGTAYQVLPSGFYAPPPPRLSSYSGAGLFRHGEDLVARSYGNRTVGISLSIMGTNASQLGSRVQSVWEYLRKAEEWSKEGLGTQVQLRYQWEGATGTYLFNVIEGNLDLGQGLHSAYLIKGTRVRGAQLELTCEPFIVRPSETLDNWLKDPSFEVAESALADWTLQPNNGTLVRTTADSKWGTASVEVRRTSGTPSNQMFQNFSATSGTLLSVSAWVKVVDGSTADFRGRLWFGWYDTTGGFLANSTAATSTGTAWVKISIAGASAPANCTTASLFLSGTGGTGAGTVRFDNLHGTVGSALPVAWVSGRNVANHYDDNGQAHINYLDVYGLPGDVPAPAQIRINEVEAHDEVWVGAAHAGRVTGTKAGYWLEGESFTSTIGPAWAAIADGTASNGSAGTLLPTSTSPTAPDVGMLNIAIPLMGQYRLLAAARRNLSGTASTGTLYLGMGYQYGGITIDPSGTAQYQKLTTSTGTQWEIYELGMITIPPSQTPVSGTVGTLGIRLAVWYTGVNSTAINVDYVHLMPIDQGGAYGSKSAAADNMWLDSITTPPALYRVTTAGVLQSFVNGQQGAPPLVHPQASRYYFQFGSANSSVGHGATVSISYQSRFLQIGT